jgi:hypothetical protein
MKRDVEARSLYAAEALDGKGREGESAEKAGTTAKR